MITQEYIKECISYNEKTGTMHWKERPRNHFNRAQDSLTWNSKFAYKKAGCHRKLNRNTHNQAGYMCISIDNKLYQSHRIIWLYVYGKFPAGQIDHISGDTLDNSISNLRDVTHIENQRNKKLLSNNKTGISGVSKWGKCGLRWRVYISNLGKHQHIGLFEDFFDACCARKSAEKELGYHTNHGRR